VPWHRIVNAKGESSIGEEQVVRLRAEGVLFGPDGRTDLACYGWSELADGAFDEGGPFG